MDIGYRLKKDIEKIVDYEIEPFEMEEDDIIGLIEDLVGAYENLEEEFEDYKQDVNDNYRPVSIAEQVGISDRDFM